MHQDGLQNLHLSLPFTVAVLVSRCIIWMPIAMIEMDLIHLVTASLVLSYGRLWCRSPEEADQPRGEAKCKRSAATDVACTNAARAGQHLSHLRFLIPGVSLQRAQQLTEHPQTPTCPAFMVFCFGCYLYGRIHMISSAKQLGPSNQLFMDSAADILSPTSVMHSFLQEDVPLQRRSSRYQRNHFSARLVSKATFQG